MRKINLFNTWIKINKEPGWFIKLEKKRIFSQDELIRICEIDSQMADLEKQWARQVKRKLREFKAEIMPKPSKEGDITQQMIEIARDFPIEDLIDVTRTGFACCPFHKERTPSFYTKNNFGHCFSCGESGDVITICMIVNQMTFKQAVKYLQGGK